MSDLLSPPRAPNAVRDFYDTLYRPGDLVSINYLPPGGAFASQIVPVDKAPETAALHLDANVWIGVNPLKPGTRGRGQTDDVARLTSVHVDFDYAGPWPGGSGRVMPDRDAVDNAIATLSEIVGTRPMTLIHTGHGIQAFWPFDPDDDDLLTLTENEDRALAKSLLARWGIAAQTAARMHGGATDNVHELARITRHPGTTNYKAEPVPVVVESDSGHPITVTQLLEALDAWGIPDAVTELDGALADAPTPASAWSPSDETTPYMRAVIEAWASDPIDGGRHQWAMVRAVRLAAGLRMGRVSAADCGHALDIMQQRLTQARANDDHARPHEILGHHGTAHGPDHRGVWDWAVARVETWTDERCEAENIGSPLRARDPLTAAPGSTEPGQKATPSTPAGKSATKVHRGQVQFAYRLAATHADQLLHVNGIGWHRWDGMCWVEDDSGAAKRAVLETLRAALLESFDKSDRDLGTDVRRCESANGVDGILRIASALEPFATTVADLDADPYLLNVANGTLDLRTMNLAPHRPADRITKVTRAAYRPGVKGERFEKFLDRVLPDTEVRAFLQRYAGVGLCGRVLEHVLAILTGTGRNGKGVFYGALGHALGDYATTAEPDLFMHRDGAHPTGEMDLRGVRWAVVSESDTGRKLAEATVKRLTGGDRIKARRMRQDFVEFDPSHTAALVTNHLPQVRGDDPAIWARLRVIPFEVVIPKAEQDVHLPEQLQLEADAILTWALEGWQDYSARGLSEPAAVSKATDEYQSDMDAVGQFITERCLLNEHMYVKFSDLYYEWAQWSTANGTFTDTKKHFGAALDARGLTADRGSGNAAIRRGIALQGGDES
ncbi:DNA primase family protein [Demequina sp. SO4-18]|uniref:DNA primase family protein n=1 Tax=Demequina sp. SO4-18 TaxID=3401026 RepID=UPI003B5C89DA